MKLARVLQRKTKATADLFPAPDLANPSSAMSSVVGDGMMEKEKHEAPCPEEFVPCIIWDPVKRKRFKRRADGSLAELGEFGAQQSDKARLRWKLDYVTAFLTDFHGESAHLRYQQSSTPETKQTPPQMEDVEMKQIRTANADNQDEEHQSLSSESSGENPLEFSDDSMDEDYLPDMDLSPKRDGKRDGKRGEKRGGKSREESDVGTSRNKHRALRSTDRKRQRIPVVESDFDDSAGPVTYLGLDGSWKTAFSAQPNPAPVDPRNTQKHLPSASSSYRPRSPSPEL